MANENRVELVIRAKDLAKKSIADLADVIDRLQSELDSVDKAGGPASRSVGELKQQLTDLKTVSDEITKRRSLAESFTAQGAAVAKLSDQLEKAKAAVLAHKEAMGATAKASKDQKDSLKALEDVVRAVLFYLCNILTVTPGSFIVVASRLLPVHTRYKLCTLWTRSSIWSARVICGIKWKVEGWENLPDAPAIVLPKHQSTWETFWLPSFLPRDLTFVYKRELNLLPFFGWGIASTQMISIDRSKGQDAFEQVVEQGTNRLGRGWWIVIFPEGTRTSPGSTRRFKSGGARLSVRTGAQVVPIAVNSGEVWPRRPFLKVPGEVTISIGAPISPDGRTADEVNALVESWIETEMRRLAPHRYSGPYVAAGRIDSRTRDSSTAAI